MFIIFPKGILNDIHHIDAYLTKCRALSMPASPFELSRSRTSPVLLDRVAERDDRIDLFRGLALLLIFIDHVEVENGLSFISRYTLRSLGFCDATEVFVFISGYVCGISYSRVLAKSGFWACQFKSFHRIGQLWIANIVTMYFVINLVVCCFEVGGADFQRYRVGGLFDPWFEQIPRIAFQLYQPHAFDILTLYMQLLLVLPLFLLAVSKYPSLTWIVVLAIYSLIQFFPWFTYPLYDFYSGHLSGALRTFNNFGWQLLFFFGCALGMRKSQARPTKVPQLVVFVSTALIIAVAVCRIIAMITLEGSIASAIRDCVHTILSSPFCRKQTEGPIRIFYFMALAVAAGSIVPTKFSLQATRLLRPIACCGKHSLIVFCVGSFLCYAAHPALKASSGSMFVLLTYELFGCGLMMWLGTLLSQWKSRLPRPEATPSGKDR